MAYCTCPTRAEFYAESGDRGVDEIKQSGGQKWCSGKNSDLAHLPHVLVFSV